ncbi:MAG: PAS domain-containing protein [Desulfobulbaceae bacterium]|nr:PAS domain-containing protein [Desulfobulbaceae bacterium]
MTSKQHNHKDAPNKQNRQAKKLKSPQNDSSTEFPVVAVGASAGGLEALKKFFQAMPPKNGMAYVVIQHLDPNHKSSMAELLGRCTDMSVLQAENNMTVLADHVYLIPPNKNLLISGCTLKLENFSKERGLRLPIDSFFRSLAATQGDKSICIILSGTGADGTLGMKSIKAEGGMAMAQDPEESLHDGMPRSAISTGLIDFILPAAKMPSVLLDYVKHSYYAGSSDRKPHISEDEPELLKILALLKEKGLSDFNSYKRGTLIRRIERRMGIHSLDSLAQYRLKLERDSRERESLSKDLLIIVTGFFRNAEAFQVLEKKVAPEICRKADADTPVRIWVPGSATGEEAYSIAVVFFETLSRLGKNNCRLQIFATDIDRFALERGRCGVFPQSIEADVAPRRLQRFFNFSEGKYCVKQFVRDAVIFSMQNLLTDPPFSKVDFISCRNLLIYLNGEAQKRIISLFHFSLKPHGFLFLGNAEGVGKHLDLFQPFNKKWRIYQKNDESRPPFFEFPLGARNKGVSTGYGKIVKPGLNLKELAERTMLKHFTPCGVVINRHHDILYFLGNTENFLKIPEGDSTTNLMAMTPTSIRISLRSLLHKITEDREKPADTVLVLPGKTRETYKIIELGVRRIDTEPQEEPLYLVTCRELPEIQTVQHKTVVQNACCDTHELVISQLESELRTTREDLENTIIMLENSNEQLKTSNEEAMSLNEEFQSTNEELETSKEELITINSQLLGKINELEKMTNDLNNLLASSEIGTLFLDAELRIKRFTPTIQKLFHLLPSDVDRPLQDFESNFSTLLLVEDATRVMEQIIPLEKELQTADGRWYLQRILPYHTATKRVEGVVITFTDISCIKKVEIKAERRAAFLQMITNIQPARMAYVDSRERYQYVNDTYLEWVMLPRDQVIDRTVRSVLGAAFYKQIAPYIQKALKGRKVHFETTLNYPDSKTRHIMADYTPNVDALGNVVGFFTLIIDITERNRLESSLRESEELHRTIGENVPFGSWTSDAQGHFTHVTKPFLDMAGMTLDEVLGFGWLSRVPQEERDELEKEWLRCLRTGRDWNYEYRFLGGDGKLYDIMALGRPIRDAKGAIKFWAGFHLDISERKKLEKELQAINRSQETKIRERTAELEEKMLQLRRLTLELTQTEQRERERLSMVLHNDMQQLLVAGKLQVESLMEKLKVNRNIKGMQQIFTIFEQLTESARNLASDLRPPMLNLRPREKMHWLADWFQEKFDLTVQLHISENFDEEKITDETSTYLFESAKELLFNTVKHAGVNTVSLSLGVDDKDCLFLIVADKGRGTDKEVLSPQENKKPGIGLRSIYDRLRSMGGDLTVTTSPANGFKADIRLPYSENSDVCRAPQTVDESIGRDESRQRQETDHQGNRQQEITIVLADDHAIVRDGLVLILQEEDDMRIVGEAASGREAVELASRLSPDVCILDVNMPDMNGIEACRLITAMVPTTRVIGLSVNGNPEIARIMTKAGAFAFHRKSDPPKELCRTIRDCVKKK